MLITLTQDQINLEAETYYESGNIILLMQLRVTGDEEYCWWRERPQVSVYGNFSVYCYIRSIKMAVVIITDYLAQKKTPITPICQINC